MYCFSSSRGPSGLFRVGEHGTGWDYTGFWGSTYATIGTLRWVVEGGALVTEKVDGKTAYEGNASIGEMHPRVPGFVQGVDGPGGANYLYMDGHAVNSRSFPTLEESGAAPR